MVKNKQNKGVSEKLQSILHPKGLAPYPFFKRYMTIEQAGYYTAQAESTIDTAIRNGELPVIQKGPRSNRYLDVYDLDRWMLAFKRFHRPVCERVRDRSGRFK